MHVYCIQSLSAQVRNSQSLILSKLDCLDLQATNCVVKVAADEREQKKKNKLSSNQKVNDVFQPSIVFPKHLKELACVFYLQLISNAAWNREFHQSTNNEAGIEWLQENLCPNTPAFYQIRYMECIITCTTRVSRSFTQSALLSLT